MATAIRILLILAYCSSYSFVVTVSASSSDDTEVHQPSSIFLPLGQVVVHPVGSSGVAPVGDVMEAAQEKRAFWDRFNDESGSKLSKRAFWDREANGKRAFWDREANGKRAFWDREANGKRAFWDREANGKRAFWDRATLEEMPKRAFWDREHVVAGKRAFWDRPDKKYHDSA